MEKFTGPQLKALIMIADNPGKVIAQYRGEKGDWLKIHGNVENSLTAGDNPLIRRQKDTNHGTFTKTIYGQKSTWEIRTWELTDAGRAALAEHQGGATEQPAAPAGVQTKRITPAQLRSLVTIAENPGRVLHTPTNKGAEWLRINGRNERSLTTDALKVHGTELIKLSDKPAATATRSDGSTYSLFVWELTDAGRAALAELAPTVTPPKPAVPAVDADDVAEGIAAAQAVLIRRGDPTSFVEAVERSAREAELREYGANLAEQLERKGASAQTVADVAAAREALAERFTCLDINPTRNSGFVATWEPTYPGAVRIGRAQGMRSARPGGPYSPATKLWDDAMTEYAEHLNGAGFRVTRTDDRGLIAYRNRPAAPVAGEGVDTSDVPPASAFAPTSVGRAGKDRLHPAFAERHAQAVQGLELLGIERGGDLTDLRIRDNAVLRDDRTGVVVKVHRPGTGLRALLELRAAWWLGEQGMPVATPLVRQPAMVGDRAVTAWVDETSGRYASEIVTCPELGELHRTLHALPVPEHFEIPAYDPWPGIAQRFEGEILFSPAQRSWLAAWAVDVRAQWEETRSGAQPVVIHGDGGPHNTLRRYRDGQALMIDWESVAVGDAVTDGVHVAWESSPFTPPAWWDEPAYVKAYGADPRELPGFAVAWKVRTLVSILFAGGSAGVSAAARSQANHRIETLINDAPRSWRWGSI